MRHIDIEALQNLALELDGRIHIRVRPGTLVHPGTDLLFIETAKEIDHDQARAAILLGHWRSFDQDPRFGLIVLSEVAQRALSPAVNDPGTAIAVMTAMTRVLVRAHPGAPAKPGAEHDRLSLVELDENDFIRQGFDPIARDGAAIFRSRRADAKTAGDDRRTGGVVAEGAGAPAGRYGARACGSSVALDDEKQAVAGLFDSLHGAAINDNRRV